MVQVRAEVGRSFRGTLFAIHGRSSAAIPAADGPGKTYPPQLWHHVYAFFLVFWASESI
ncbi:hypothetical protein [Oceanicoccus sagamiensis]|uniref:hypothetical protein n=1 Tax=Oceanicoccus sagamiensis TaxID=716816 RepID=UPI0012F488C9|nr:hypothetical protein [Oceanicoccus sagamiensis]